MLVAMLAGTVPASASGGLSCMCRTRIIDENLYAGTYEATVFEEPKDSTAEGKTSSFKGEIGCSVE